MGKVDKSAKPNQTQSAKSTRVIKQNAIKKPAAKVSKRLIMLQRRINVLQNEQSSWMEKNKELLDHLKTERMLSASLRKESFHWQQLYHEATMSVNTYKVKQAEMAQTMTSCLREIDAIYPHMVAFSENVTSNKIRIYSMLNSLPSSEYSSGLPRLFQENGKVIDDSVKKNEKPMKQRVGPMVRGCLITKPKIMLERIMVPQQQDQEPENVDMSPVNHQLTPIAEENEHEENIHLRHISMRPKRKLGKPWPGRRKGKFDNERNRGNKSPLAAAYDGDSSDTESNHPAMNLLEPVVRFKDVSRMLQNSSLVKVDASCTEDNEVVGSSAKRQTETETRRVPVNIMKRTAEDPLEGSSWMFNNSLNRLKNYRPSHSSERRSTIYKSDSSDDDDDENIIVPKKSASSLSPMNTLIIQNKTFNISNKSRNSSSAETSRDTLDESPPAEPDSTNNIDVSILNNFSFKNGPDDEYRSSSSTSNRSFPSSNTSTNTSSLLNKPSESSEQRISINTNALTVRLSKVPSDIKLSLSNISSNGPTPNQKHSSFYNNSSEIQHTPETLGKRVRKPKTHLYPGEETLPPPKTNKCNPPKVPVGRKSLSDKKKTNGKKITTKRSFVPRVSTSAGSTDDSTKTTKSSKESNIATNVAKKITNKNRSLVPRVSTSIGEGSTDDSTKNIRSSKESSVGTIHTKKLNNKNRSLVPRVSTSVGGGSTDESTKTIKRSKGSNGCTNVAKKITSKKRSLVPKVSASVGEGSTDGSTKTTNSNKENNVGTNVAKNITSKKSSLKKSIKSSRASSITGRNLSLDQIENVTRPRRGNTTICYKEIPLIIKLRRP